jgi:hypothetical protein
VSICASGSARARSPTTLRGALVDGDLPDGVTAQQVAEELHDLLRPYI